MANSGIDNLVVPTSEQARKYGSKGGKASAEAKRKRKAMREQMELLLNLPLKNEKLKKRFEDMGIDADDLDNQMALVVATYQQALKGNINAVNTVREIIGERIQQISLNTNIDEKVKELQKALDEM